MYARLTFLRNPRYPALPLTVAPTLDMRHVGSSSGSGSVIGRSPGARTSVHSSSSTTGGVASAEEAATGAAAAAGFLVLPMNTASFTSYEPGRTYFATVQLQNVGTTLAGLRLLPPASRYFQASLLRWGIAELCMRACMHACTAVGSVAGAQACIG